MSTESIRETFDQVTRSRIRMPSSRNINITKRLLLGEKATDVAIDLGVNKKIIYHKSNNVLWIAFRSYGFEADRDYITMKEAKEDKYYWLSILYQMEGLNERVNY